jgi:2-oxoglutarate dehydrogenase E1 component
MLDLLSGENATFLDEKYRAWLSDPQSVEPGWRALFEEMSAGEAPATVTQVAPPPPDLRSLFSGSSSTPSASPSRGGTDDAHAMRVARRQSAVVQFINAWRVRGHFKADIDPLGRTAAREHPELTLGYYGLTPADLDAVVPTPPVHGLGETATLRQIVAHLESVYGGHIGAEYMNIDNLEQKLWVQRQLETLPARRVLDADEERRVLRKLCDGENFERMLHQKFPGTKRFSLEGGETLVPLMDRMIAEASKRGVSELVIGMAHRGRLNVLANTLEKPIKLIVEEFQDSRGPVHGSGDVKYHLGYSSDVVTASGRSVHLTLTPNPSHLEVVNAVVEGRVRAKQDRVGDTDRTRTMPVLLHGDAAFIGQGSVAEVLQLAELDGYRTGGTIHIIVNNQIGFTTAPKESRSTPYATDVARMMAIPIFHVNGEDPAAVAAVVRVAVEWRLTFGRDVVIDMYCYRKHGHNEGDEPSFTQPLMYDTIRSRPTPREVYAQKLVKGGTISAEEAARIFQESRSSIDADAASTDDPGSPDGNLESELGPPSPAKLRWQALSEGRLDQEVDTAFDLDLLVPLLERVNALPEGFHAHAKVARLIDQRLEMARGKRGLDWAMAEQAAFATLVSDGIPVRLSGQDSGRGTFSQRHAVWTDTRTGDEHFSLDHVASEQGRFWVIDSNLSEFAVLGFEYGWSLDYPDALVLWEAQFGDFANGAQVVIDQYIASAEQKWGRKSGLVLLLPHGYEGQGPEHSSARLERYLQLCAQDNIQVANCTTPANYFHLLRRQALRTVRKPLVLMTPKSLLRNPACTSPVEELARGGFLKVIPDPRALTDVRRVVFCSGHVYYDLVEHFAKFPDASRVAVHRVELLYPFPAQEILAALAATPDVTDVVWCQEEPRNMGAWPMLDEWLGAILPPTSRLRYVGRAAAASPATGSHRQHHAEQERFLHDALTLDAPSV